MCTSSYILRTINEYFDIIKTEILKKKKKILTFLSYFGSACYAYTTINCFCLAGSSMQKRQQGRVLVRSWLDQTLTKYNIDQNLIPVALFENVMWLVHCKLPKSVLCDPLPQMSLKPSIIGVGEMKVN